MLNLKLSCYFRVRSLKWFNKKLTYWTISHICYVKSYFTINRYWCILNLTWWLCSNSDRRFNRKCIIKIKFCLGILENPSWIIIRIYETNFKKITYNHRKLTTIVKTSYYTHSCEIIYFKWLDWKCWVKFHLTLNNYF